MSYYDGCDIIMKKNKKWLLLICAVLMFVMVCGCKGNAAQESKNQTIESVKLEENIIPKLTLESDSNEIKNGKCQPGDYIRLVSKDKKKMTYSLMTKTDGGEWHVEKRNISREVTIQVPDEPCFFSARLVPADKNTKDSSSVRSFYITVYKKTAQKQINASELFG